MVQDPISPRQAPRLPGIRLLREHWLHQHLLLAASQMKRQDLGLISTTAPTHNCSPMRPIPPLLHLSPSLQFLRVAAVAQGRVGTSSAQPQLSPLLCSCCHHLHFQSSPGPRWLQTLREGNGSVIPGKKHCLLRLSLPSLSWDTGIPLHVPRPGQPCCLHTGSPGGLGAKGGNQPGQGDTRGQQESAPRWCMIPGR